MEENESLHKTIYSPEHTLLEEINEEIDHFPLSSDVPTMLYDPYSVLKVLQEKEIDNIEADKLLIERGNEISRQFGRITPALITKDIEEAILQHREIEERAEKELTGNIYLYAKQWGLSVKALYHYKKRDYDGAFSITLECIALNEYLIRQGMHSLLFRCAEQNRNISRIFFKKGLLEKGATLAGGILDFLLNGVNNCLYGSIFTREIWNSIPYVREGYTCSYFRGLMEYMIDRNTSRGEKQQLFQLMFAGLEFDTNTIDRLIIYNWIYIKKKETGNAYTEFLSCFLEFMREPIHSNYNIVKSALIQDLAHFVKQSDFIRKDQLRDRLSRILIEKYNDLYKIGEKSVSNSGAIIDLKIPIPGT